MTTELETVVMCKHTVTQGKKGEKGSWCVDCGKKIYGVDERECKNCIHFFDSLGYTGCRKHLMAVSPDMHVTFKIEEGSCWSDT